MPYHPLKHKSLVEVGLEGGFIFSLLLALFFEAGHIANTYDGGWLALIAFLIGAGLCLGTLVIFRTRVDHVLLWFQSHAFVAAWILAAATCGTLLVVGASFVNRIAMNTPVLERAGLVSERTNFAGRCRLVVSTLGSGDRLEYRCDALQFRPGQRVTLTVQKGLLGFWVLQSIRPQDQASNPRVESDALARLTRTRYVPFAGGGWLWQN